MSPSWSASAYGWIVERAKKGKIAVVASSPQTDFLTSYLVSLGATSAINLTIPDSATASSQATADALSECSGVFLKGGDQAAYLSAFAGTKVQAALVATLAKGGVVAGTSAGAHVLSGIVYDAKNGGIYPEEALRDAYDPHMSFTEGFLPTLPDVVADTHFTARGRLARLLPMLARYAVEAPGRDVLGVGLDEKTALLVEPDGRARVVGQGAVTFARRSATSKAAAAPGAAPALTDVALDCLTEGYVFDLKTRTIVAHPPAAVAASPAPYAAAGGAIMLTGASAADASRGSVALAGVTGSPNAFVSGGVGLSAGSGDVPGALVVTRLFASADLDFVENRAGGALWAFTQPTAAPLALLLDEGAKVTAGASLIVGGGATAPAVIVLDGTELVETATTPYAPRQSVAPVGLRAHLLASGWSFASGVTKGP